MGTINTGGPAFPHDVEFSAPSVGANWRKKHGGMSLRDYFAAKAMGATFYPAIQESIRINTDLDCGKVAEFAYIMADAMLAEREKGSAA